jgi:hypothetical protein
VRFNDTIEVINSEAIPYKVNYLPGRLPSPGLTPEPEDSNSAHIPADENRVEELLDDSENQEEEMDASKDGIQSDSNESDSSEETEDDQGKDE